MCKQKRARIDRAYTQCTHSNRTECNERDEAPQWKHKTFGVINILQESCIQQHKSIKCHFNLYPSLITFAFVLLSESDRDRTFAWSYVCLTREPHNNKTRRFFNNYCCANIIRRLCADLDAVVSFQYLCEYSSKNSVPRAASTIPTHSAVNQHFTHFNAAHSGRRALNHLQITHSIKVKLIMDKTLSC